MRSDELTVTIKDAYPKARHHYLVLPREDIPHLRALRPSHVPLLEKMLENGRKLAKEVKGRGSVGSERSTDEGSANDRKLTASVCEEKGLMFQFGYHASPSMSRLHMHVISQDFDSPCLKNKKHWNSFTSPFFLDAEKVIDILRKEGKVELDVKGLYEPMLKLPLKCHVCSMQLKNIPKLKDHIRSHLK